MHLDATAAKALATIIFANIQAADELKLQLPLQTIDRGGSWLVKGTPYTDDRRGVHFCFSHVILRKDTAEVVSIDTDIRQVLTDAEEKHWHNVMSDEVFDRIFGLRTQFEESGPNLTRNLMMNAALNGGLINSSKDAIAYAKVIMDLNPHLAAIPNAALRADERSEVWHISVSDLKSGEVVQVMSFSRLNGKVLSGDL